MKDILAIVGLVWLAFNIAFAVMTIGPNAIRSVRRRKIKPTQVQATDTDSADREP